MKVPSIQELTQKICKPCEGGVRPLALEEASKYTAQIPGWTLSPDGKLITRDFLMKDFMAAIDFIRRVAQVAESEDHHPDLHITGYRKLRIELATHSIGGLSENDFILAAKIDQLPKTLKQTP